jgi:hypothetical protein
LHIFCRALIYLVREGGEDIKDFSAKIFLILLCSLVLFSCTAKRSCREIFEEYSRSYGSLYSGVLYKSEASEWEDGYISNELFSSLYDGADPNLWSLVDGTENIWKFKYDMLDCGSVVFHCGTAEKNGKIVTNGGRVLGVCATQDTLQAALDLAYARTEKIHFEGAFYRHDIGRRALLAGKE